MYCRICEYCGSNLDPGEICDCKKEAAPELEPPEAAQVNDLTESITGKNYFAKDGECGGTQWRGVVYASNH